MFSEVCVLPKQNEIVGDHREFAMNVIYVGHKPTTRNEQIQRNWTIEVQTYTESDEDSDDSQQEQLSRRPRKNKKQQTKRSASAASPDPRRSPREKKIKNKNNRRKFGKNSGKNSRRKALLLLVLTRKLLLKVPVRMPSRLRLLSKSPKVPKKNWSTILRTHHRTQAKSGKTKINLL